MKPNGVLESLPDSKGDAIEELLAAFPCFLGVFGLFQQQKCKHSAKSAKGWTTFGVKTWSSYVWWCTYCVVVQLWCSGPARGPTSASAVTYLSPQGWGGLLRLNSLLPAREMQSELRGCHEPGQADSSHLIPQRTNRAQGKALKFHRDLFLKHYNQVERFQLSH